MDGSESQAEHEWVERARRGEERALEYLIDQYKEAVFGYLMNRLHHREDASDCAQNVFVKMIRALPRYEARGQFRAWILTIARNEMLNFVKKRDRIATLPIFTGEGEVDPIFEKESHEETGPAVIRNERADAVRDCVSRLPEREREVLEWRLQEDLSFREISDILNRPLNTVLSQMRRASERLQDCLLKKGIESSR